MNRTYHFSVHLSRHETCAPDHNSKIRYLARNESFPLNLSTSVTKISSHCFISVTVIQTKEKKKEPERRIHPYRIPKPIYNPSSHPISTHHPSELPPIPPNPRFPPAFPRQRISYRLPRCHLAGITAHFNFPFPGPV